MILRIVGSKPKNGITSCQARRQAGALEAYFPAHFSLKASSSAAAISAVGALQIRHSHAETRSACICLAVRRWLRDLRCSVTSQPDSLFAHGASLLGRPDVRNRGQRPPPHRYFLVVLRDSPVRRTISWMGILSRNAQRRMTLKNPMSITPTTPDKSCQGHASTWVKSQ